MFATDRTSPLSQITQNGAIALTLAPGFKIDLGRHAEFGCCYQFPVSNSKQSLYGDQLIAELILRY